MARLISICFIIVLWACLTCCSSSENRESRVPTLDEIDSQTIQSEILLENDTISLGDSAQVMCSFLLNGVAQEPSVFISNCLDSLDQQVVNHENLDNPFYLKPISLGTNKYYVLTLGWYKNVGIQKIDSITIFANDTAPNKG